MPNMYDLLSQFQQAGPEFINNYCVINGAIFALDEIEKIGYDEFGLRAKFNMPMKLYKYFPNVAKEEKTENGNTTQINYSLQALKSNCVYLNSPDQFDDPYDSDIYVPWEEYSFLRLKQYANWGGCDANAITRVEDAGYALSQKMYSALTNGKDIESIFSTDERQDGEKLSISLFCLRVKNELGSKHDWHESIAQALRIEYSEFVKSIQRMFRVSCFATTPFSQLMWGGAYADCHRGFCIEYTVDPNNPQYKDVYYNLFPVVYCKTRKKVTENMMCVQDAILSKEELWDIYFHGALRKSFDWAYQNEWRLLLPGNHKDAGFTKKFFPITKVYLGNRMPSEKRKEVIEICHEKNIPYIGVTRAGNRFEMQECNTLCENCPQYIMEK